MLKCNVVSIHNHMRANQVGLKIFKIEDSWQKLFFSYNMVQLGLIESTTRIIYDMKVPLHVLKQPL